MGNCMGKDGPTEKLGGDQPQPVTGGGLQPTAATTGPAPYKPPPPPPKEPSYPVYVGKYDYDSRTDDDLSFKKGALMYIISTDEGDWWFARAKTRARKVTSRATMWLSGRAWMLKSKS